MRSHLLRRNQNDIVVDTLHSFGEHLQRRAKVHPLRLLEAGDLQPREAAGLLGPDFAKGIFDEDAVLNSSGFFSCSLSFWRAVARPLAQLVACHGVAAVFRTRSLLLVEPLLTPRSPQTR